MASNHAAPKTREDFAPTDLHRAQDLQSLLMHQEAVRLVRLDPRLLNRLSETLARWATRQDPNSRPLLKRWEDIVATQEWDVVLSDSDEAQQLRQAAPMATLLPEETRLQIIRRVKALKDARTNTPDIDL